MPLENQSVYYRRVGQRVPPGVVITPGGFRPPHYTHHVPQGHQIRLRKKELQIVHRRSQRIVSRHQAIHAADLIPGLGSGWVTYAFWQNPTDGTISQIATSWTVPPEPAIKDAGQTVFIFNGLQNSSGSNLLQPVLQWGTSQAGGGNYWTISNWYIDTFGHVYYSDCLPVLPGQVINGSVSLGGESNGRCTYTVGFNDYPQIDLNATGVDPSIIAVAVLEAYQIGDRDEYPETESTSMFSIFIAAGKTAPAIEWKISGNPAGFGENTRVVNSANPNGEIEILY